MAEQNPSEDGDLNDMLQELRILLQGSQLLTGFLTVLPFSDGFAKIDDLEKWIYLATFVFSLTSLVLFSAPAAHHRLVRPLLDRARFKNFSTRMIVGGIAAMSLALILACQLVVAQVVGMAVSLVVAGLIAMVVVGFWWVLPLTRKGKV